MHPVAINEAEGLLAPFYQGTETDWDFTGAEEPDAHHASWDSLIVSWPADAAGKVAVRFARNLDIDLSLYDHLMVRCALPADCRLTLRATVDGRDQAVLEGVRGVNHYHEFAGPVTGRRLSRLVMEIVPGQPGAAQANFLWIGCYDSKRLDFMLNRASPYDGNWQLYLREPAGSLSPTLGVFFGEDELVAIRRKVQREPYRGILDTLRRQARIHLGSLPHRSIREHLEICGGLRYGRSRAAGIPTGDRISFEAMRLCAFVGLVDNDPALARVAVDHALAAAHCSHWDDSFMATLPGTLWDHRAFTANGILEGFVMALDWAGGLLNDQARILFGRTISDRVLPKVDMSLRRFAYMRHCNQAIVFAQTGILSVSALARLWEHGGDGLDWYIDVLRESTANYIAADGGAFEGGAYYDWSCSMSLRGFHLAARTKRIPLKELIPECLRRAPGFYLALASARCDGTFINYADGGRPGVRYSGEAVPILAAITGDAGLQRLLAACLQPDREGSRRATVHALIHGPETLPAEPFELPVFAAFPDTGYVSSCRRTSDGVVRLAVIGAQAGAGHTHQDKGSFVLEAFGEEILIDPGICDYGDSRSTLMGAAHRHNMLTPDAEDNSPHAAICPSDGAMIPEGTGDEKSVRIQIDGTPQWKDHLAKWMRVFTSEEPTRLVIDDTAERKTRGSVSLHFQSRSPWTRRSDGWVTEGKSCRCVVTPEWPVARAEGVEDLCDGRYAPVFRLTLRTSPAQLFQLRTRISVSSLSRPVLTAPQPGTTGREYHAIRGGLDNCRLRFARDKMGRVVFLGGSITEGSGWRDLVCQELSKRFPDTKFDFINAGIASMGSTPGAFRFSRDVLKNGPVDLLFEEAAVNDETNGQDGIEQIRGMEGIVRQARMANPAVDIVLLHFVDPRKMEIINSGRVPPVIASHEKVAVRYNLPSINLAQEVTERIRAGEFTWEKDFIDLHPSPFGHQLYFRSICRLLDAAWVNPAAGDAQMVTHKLPEPVDARSYFNGRLVAITEARIDKTFQVVPNWTPSDGAGTRPGFVNVPMLVATDPGAALRLPFHGTAVGIFVAAGPDVGVVEYSIDGGPVRSLDLFTEWSSWLHLPWALVLDADLDDCQHEVLLRTAAAKNPASKGYAVRIANFLVNGNGES